MSRRKLAAAGHAVAMHRRAQCSSAAGQRSVERASQQLRVLTLTARIGAAITGGFGLLQLLVGATETWTGLINMCSAVVFLLTPKLARFGRLVAPLTFVAAAYVSLVLLIWAVGTGSGLQFYFLAAAAIAVLILGVEHVVLAAVVAAVGAGLVIMLEFLVPEDAGIRPHWLMTAGFITTVISVVFISVAAVWVALREMARAEAALEAEYQRSEALLTNILPSEVADRLKQPDHDVIADRYDDASVLFADIVGFTRFTATTSPDELVRYLDRLYTAFDELVDRYRLEKIKTTGDSYMAVSGVPEPRPDHLAALADFALDMAEAVTRTHTPHGRPLQIRIGLADGPVVAGVIGSRRFFYDVWGDAVNVAARMETTASAGRIQVPHNVYERLCDEFVFEGRGDVEIKGKGAMRTWYLQGRRQPRLGPGTVLAGQAAGVTGAHPQQDQTGDEEHRHPEHAVERAQVEQEKLGHGGPGQG